MGHRGLRVEQDLEEQIERLAWQNRQLRHVLEAVGRALLALATDSDCGLVDREQRRSDSFVE